MKVITIGRDLDNDIVINDAKVSRHHLQIIKENSGNFRIVDFGSTNGTFVNDRKISGEIMISINDVVRIGNSTLPWQTYFSDKKTNPIPTKTSIRSLSWIAGVAVILAAIVITSIFIFSGKTTVKMREENGVRYIPMKINGQELDFVFDTGASSICISTLEAAILAKNGLLSENDVIGEQGFVDATGRFSVGTKINLKTVKIGDRELNNVEATIIENPGAECLLGQTVLSRFGTYKIDNTKKEIVFE
jgi:clan AA aspartic protease (TIGR02281 family)